MMRSVMLALCLGALVITGCGGTAEIKPAPKTTEGPTTFDTSAMQKGMQEAQKHMDPAMAEKMKAGTLSEEEQKKKIEEAKKGAGS